MKEGAFSRPSVALREQASWSFLTRSAGPSVVLFFCDAWKACLIQKSHKNKGNGWGTGFANILKYSENIPFPNFTKLLRPLFQAAQYPREV